MRLNKSTDSVKFRGEDGTELVVRWTNRGEPYREGVELALDEPDYKPVAYVFLEHHEALQLRDLLNRLYPPPSPPLSRPHHQTPNQEK